MSSILINALLSSAPNYDILFDALSWPSDSWPERERVEALTTLIEGLGPLLTGSSADPITFTAAKRQCLIGKIESIIRTQCIPLLSQISEEYVASKGIALQDQRCRESTTAVCRLLGACISLCDENVARQVSVSVLPSLQLSDGDSEEEVPGQGRLNLDVAIEAVAVLLPALSSDEHLTAIALSSALSCIKRLPDAVVSKITVRILLTLITCQSGARLWNTLSFILDNLCNWHLSSCTPVATERTLLCLTALSDHLLPSAKPHQPLQNLASGRPDPRLSVQFWRVVQDGLTHGDNVSRKRALYLLKRCVVLSEEEGVECRCSVSGEGERCPLS